MEFIIDNVMLITECKNRDLVRVYANKAKKFIERYVGIEYTDITEIEDLIEDITIDYLNNMTSQKIGELSISYKNNINNKEIMNNLRKLRAKVGVNGGVNVW